MDKIRKVLEKLQECDLLEDAVTVKISSIYDFAEGGDMWQGLIKNIPEELLDSVVLMVEVQMKHPEYEVEKISFEVPELSELPFSEEVTE